MKFSCDWLARYVDLPAPQELAERLTFAGLAVEGLEEVAGEVVLDIDVTTNRPDCMNHLGLAREIAVLLDRPLRPPHFSLEETAETADRVSAAAMVLLEHPADCPRYVGRVVRGVRVGPSPDWLRRLLTAIGLRSINNVVDVTNFVLWELGQPLHAYDLQKLAGAPATVVVRRARSGERLTTLDGVERKLDSEILVIADAERPIGLAGVMGGGDSEVTEATTDLLIEAAHFDRARVRVATKKLGLHTDASHRFERGADFEACLLAADRTAALIAELAGGRVMTGALDLRGQPPAPRRGKLVLADLNRFAGAEIAADDAERWLSGLGFVPRRLEGAWEVTVPSWRYYDFEPRPWIPGSSAATSHVAEVYPADLFEEMIRMHGFDRIPAALPALGPPDGHPNPAYRRRRKIRSLLAACGFAEAIHYAFQSPEADASLPVLAPAAGESEPVKLANPLSERYSLLRRSVLPNLVESARFNQRRGAAAVRLFEMASVFFGRHRPEEGELPEQPEYLGLVCGGTVDQGWERGTELDFFDLKGVVESVAADFGVPLEARAADGLPGLLPGSSAELWSEGRRAGVLGRLESEEGYPLYVAELVLDVLRPEAVSLKVEPPSRFPGVGADFTLTHPVAVSWTELQALIAEHPPADLVSYGLKGRYRGEGVPAGAVNTTISFLYNAQDRSLTQDEVNERQLALSRKLGERFGWKG